MTKKKVLIVGWTPCAHSSYGNIIRDLATRICDIYDVTVLTTRNDKNTWKYDPTIFKFKVISPNGYVSEEDAKDGLDTYCRLVGKEIDVPNVVILIDDAYHMGRWANTPRRKDFKIIMYPPIDGYPYPYEYLDILNKADAIVAYTKISAAYISSKVSATIVDIIPAGVDTDEYYPESDEERDRLREQMPKDTLNMLFIGKNQPRKLNWQLLEIVARLTYGHYYMCSKCGYVLQYQHLKYSDIAAIDSYFMEKPIIQNCPICKGKGVKSNIIKGTKIPVRLWLHTPPGIPISSSGQPQGWDISKYVEYFDISKETVMTQISKDGKFEVTTKEMRSLINAHDIVLQITGGEGFGMPALESLLCGVPVVYSDYSAHTHFLKGLGFPVKIAAFEHRMASGIRRGHVDMFSAVKLLKNLYENKQAIGRARAKIIDNLPRLRDTYSWDNVAKQWATAIDTVCSGQDEKKVEAIWC